MDKDVFKGATWLTAPTVPMLFSRSWQLRALLDVDCTYLCAVQLYAALSPGDDWAFYDMAADSSGRRFDVLEIHRDVDPAGQGIVLVEHVAVHLPLEYVEEARLDGLVIKIWGQRGEVGITVPPYYVAAFLDRLTVLSELSTRKTTEERRKAEKP